jgi:hypothetical protein
LFFGKKLDSFLKKGCFPTKKSARLFSFSTLFLSLLVSCATKDGASSVQSSSVSSFISASLLTERTVPFYVLSLAAKQDADFYFLADNVLSRLDGSLLETAYRADVNLDHAFDDKDVLSSKRLFCLTSPTSFSCANLVFSYLKDSGSATLLGKTSGGGGCDKHPCLLADGTAISISDCDQFVSVKNGSAYSADEGVTPDVEITSLRRSMTAPL